MISTTWWPSCGRRTTPTKWLTSSTRAVRVEAARAAAKLEAAHELKEAVRAGFESPAREAAAAATDRRAAAHDRKMAARDRAHNEGVVELLRARVKAVGDWSEA